MGLGSRRNTTTQQAAPASSGTQTTSAPPLAHCTRHNAIAAPPQTGSSRMAMMNLIHFGTRPEFRIRNSEARRNRADEERKSTTDDRCIQFSVQSSTGTNIRRLRRAQRPSCFSQQNFHFQLFFGIIRLPAGGLQMNVVAHYPMGDAGAVFDLASIVGSVSDP